MKYTHCKNINIEYEVVIGLEVHVQLLTKSKMFCSCSANYQFAPSNTLVCPVCIGLPGALPVINNQAVEFVIMTGLALESDISKYTKFDRKNYPYPDLMKGYQISQYEAPIANHGSLSIESGQNQKSVRVTRVHLEEDVAKLLHRTNNEGIRYSLLDLNRAGVPLMEVVSEPDMRNPEEARSFLIELRSILRYIGVSTANMEEGSFRCDANISVRPRGSDELGAKVEVKNMNSLKSVYGALEYETERQIGALHENQRIIQETRGWNEERAITVSQRSKEYASDYRYFPEPDLPPLDIEMEWVSELKKSLSELPQARKRRFVLEYRLTEDDARLLTISKQTADFFERVLECGLKTRDDGIALAKSVSNWVLGELSRLINQTSCAITDVKIKPQQFIDMLKLIDDGTLNNSMAKVVFEEMFNSGKSAGEIAESMGMSQISDLDFIHSVIKDVIFENPKPVQDYIKGKETAVKFLVGQVMKTTRGTANPMIVTELLGKEMDAMR